MEIVRVCNPVEREIFAPHVERLQDALRVLDNLAKAFEPAEGLQFDPDRFAWVRPEKEKP